MQAIILNTTLDNHFITLLDSKSEGVTFTRIDSDLSDILKNSDKEMSEEDNKVIEDIFKEAISSDKVSIKIESLKTTTVPAMISISEQSRRMAEMAVMYGGDASIFPKEETLVVNISNSLIQNLNNIMKDESKKDVALSACRHIYDLAKISHGQLSPQEMTEFISRSNSLIEKLMK